MDNEYPAIVTWAGLLIPLLTALLTIRPSKGVAGPRRTRRFQRIVDQAAALQQTTDKQQGNSRSSTLLRAATAQQQEALLEEIGRLRHPFAPCILIIAMGVIYMSIGLTEIVEQGESGALLAIAGIAVWSFGLLILFYQAKLRRGIVLRGRSSFPLVSPLQQHFNDEYRASFRQKELRMLARRRVREMRRGPARNRRVRKARSTGLTTLNGTQLVNGFRSFRARRTTTRPEKA